MKNNIDYIYFKQKSMNAISIEELLKLEEDVCIVIPRTTFYLCNWIAGPDNKNNKIIRDIIKKYIEFNKQYDLVFEKGRGKIRNYLVLLEDAKSMIEFIKNNIEFQKFYVKNIRNDEYKQIIDITNQKYKNNEYNLTVKSPFVRKLVLKQK